MKAQYGIVAILCLTMSLAVSVNMEDADAIQIVRSVGPGGDFSTIQAAMDWVKNEPNNDYTFNVNSQYTGETYPITIDIRSSLGHAAKNIEIHGYVNMGSPTVLSGSSKIFDIVFYLTGYYSSKLTITDFDMKVDNNQNDVVYIHGSKNVEISSCIIGGYSNNHKCSNGVKALNSQDIWLNAIEFQYCYNNAVYFNDVNNHDKEDTQRGISGSTIINNGNGIRLEGSYYIRCIDNDIGYNEDRGIYVLNSNSNVITTSTMFSHEIFENDIGIEIKGDDSVCNYNHISNYDINTNNDYGILFDHAGRDNYQNENVVENVKIHNNYDGIHITHSYDILLTGEYTEIYRQAEYGSGINILFSNWINIDLEKDSTADAPSVYENYCGVYVQNSYRVNIKNIILEENGFRSLYSSKEQIVFNDCTDFYLGEFVYLSDPIYDGLYVYQCTMETRGNEIENVIINGFDSVSGHGIIIEDSSYVTLEDYSDDDQDTHKPLKIEDSSYITVKDVHFNRSSYDASAVGIYVKSSDNVEMTRSDGMPRNYLNNFSVGIEMTDCYNTWSNKFIEYFDIDNCAAGISVNRVYINPSYFFIRLLYIETDHCDVGIELNYMKGSYGAANPAVMIIRSYLNNSDDYGIYMQGSELVLQTTHIKEYGDGGIYNTYYDYDSVECGGWLHIVNDCSFSDTSGDNQVYTYGKSDTVKTYTYDYLPIDDTKEVNNYPFGEYRDES